MDGWNKPLDKRSMKMLVARPGRTVRWLARILNFVLAMTCVSGVAAVISIPNPATNDWRANLASFNSDTYIFTDLAGIFTSTSFAVRTFLDDNTSNLIAPVGSLMFPSGTNLMVSGACSRTGNTFDASKFYQNGPTDTFLSRGEFYDGTVSGANNFVGIEIADKNGGQHYGWLQYTFAAYNNGAAAVIFNGGYLNDVAGAGVVAGTVPEPPAAAIVVVGVLSLVSWHRRRARRTLAAPAR